MSQNIFGVTPLHDESAITEKPALFKPLFIKDSNNEIWKISDPRNFRRSTVPSSLFQLPRQRQPSTTSLSSKRSKKASLPPLPTPPVGRGAATSNNYSQYFNTVSTVSTLDSYPMTPSTPTNAQSMPPLSQMYPSVACPQQQQQLPSQQTLRELYLPQPSIAPATPPPLSPMFPPQGYLPFSMHPMHGDQQAISEITSETENQEKYNVKEGQADGNGDNGTEEVTLLRERSAHSGTSNAADKYGNKKIRQITVKSINNDYNVWINVDPKDTGESIAAKIFTIASFKTRKVLSIKTASGRKIPLDKTPVFADWEIMENFKNGEIWTVEWDNTKRSFVDKVLSKLL
ncbi:hypothetical protein BDF20DRAFT_896436 [Mycotypha africana]|uniref:uncharacterized protein n=1 Tax=Mycotypha africana TaxID=64632 RepID=UPI002300E857|nr:uncharacterized protein BDF20DRAFT_896436 [Mycotypha africana]KAI8968446.1 hypothetical protein BDF20DRAFT_896436 [Mycotypha africana]